LPFIRKKRRLKIVRYQVSPTANKKQYSGGHGEKLFKTLAGAKARIKLVKKITGKKYYISEIS